MHADVRAVLVLEVSPRLHRSVRLFAQLSFLVCARVGVLLFPFGSRDVSYLYVCFFFQAEDGIRDGHVTGVQTCALPIYSGLYPENDLPKVGHPYNYGVEGVISLSPDLVISAQENMKPETAAQLRDAGIPVLVLSHSGEGGMEALYTRIGQIATVFEVEERGEELVNRIRSDLDALQSELTQIPEDERLEVMFIYSHSLGDSTIYGGEDTGPGVLIELAGADDAADFIDGAHVTISSEALVTANPDVIIMMQRGLDAIGGVSGYLQLPGVSLTTAGHNEAIYTVDDSVRWIGPRFPQFAAQLARDLYGIEVP